MIDVANASYTGIVVGSIIAIVTALGRAMGLRTNSEMMLGTLVVWRSASLAWVTGAAMSVLVFAGVGLVYAMGLEYVPVGSGPLGAVAFAVVHTAVSGLSLAAMPMVHPAMRVFQVPEPGIFKWNYGPIDAFVFVVLHLGFGTLFGVTYIPLALAAHGS